jgi:heat shock protein HtpX
MAATLALIISLSTLALTILLSLAGVFNYLTLGIIIVTVNVAQWLFAPYLIDAMYRVHPIPESENPQLHEAITNISKKSGISKPRLMLAKIPLPNAFAYGSPIAGNRVAVTEGLLKNLDGGEVEAVIGHEVGHLKHRDVQVMMAVSILPALFTYLAYIFMFQGQGSRRGEGGNTAIIGLAFLAFSWVLNFFILYLSRLREYYADRHGASVVESGAQRLSSGLAKIVRSTQLTRMSKGEKQNLTSFKALFITDPDKANVDAAALSSAEVSKENLVQEILSREPTFADKVIEAMSTHPNIIKRLRALQNLT